MKKKKPDLNTTVDIVSNSEPEPRSLSEPTHRIIRPKQNANRIIVPSRGNRIQINEYHKREEPQTQPQQEPQPAGPEKVVSKIPKETEIEKVPKRKGKTKKADKATKLAKAEEPEGLAEPEKMPEKQAATQDQKSQKQAAEASQDKKFKESLDPIAWAKADIAKQNKALASGKKIEDIVDEPLEGEPALKPQIKKPVSATSPKGMITMKAHERPKIETGIPGFDQLLGGGLPLGNIVIVSGGCGVGKSTFCTQFLYDGAQKGEPGIYITFEQSAESIKESAYQFGMDLDELEQQNLLSIIEVEPTKILNLVKEGYGQIVEEVNRMGAKRVVVDALNAFEIMFREDFERRRVLFDFFRWLRQHKVTSLIISEIEQTLHENREVDISEFIADGVVHMYSILQNNVREFALEIIKMRQAKVLTKVCPFRFESSGISVYPEEEVFSQI